MSKKLKLVPLAVVLVVLIVVSIVAISRIPYRNDRDGIKQTDTAIQYEIGLNYTLSDVSRELEELGVVKSDSYFYKWVCRNHPEFSCNPSVYSVNSNLSYEQLVSALQEPVVDRSLVSVCIPEGKRVVDIATTLEQNGVCSAKEFLDEEQAGEFEFQFVKDIKNVDKRGYRLEGYLFPATYDLQKNSTAHEVLQKFLQAFADRLESNGWQSKCDKLGITLDQAVTMASVVEAEASSASADDRALVSSVFWNRIHSPAFSLLQSDPTVFYADLLEDKGFPRSVWKGYTTYSCKGLPTGAINCPGEVSINAALDPAKSDYCYFFTYDKGSTMVYVFTEDYQQFQTLARQHGVM